MTSWSMARSALRGRRGDGGVNGQSPEADLHGGHHPALRASVELSASRYRLVPLTNGNFLKSISRSAKLTPYEAESIFIKNKAN